MRSNMDTRSSHHCCGDTVGFFWVMVSVCSFNGIVRLIAKRRLDIEFAHQHYRHHG